MSLMIAKEYSIKIIISLVYWHTVVKQSFSVSGKMKCFDYKGGCTLMYSKLFHKVFNSIYRIALNSGLGIYFFPVIFILATNKSGIY